jgi:hypothetical protein
MKSQHEWNAVLTEVGRSKGSKSIFVNFKLSLKNFFGNLFMHAATPVVLTSCDNMEMNKLMNF